MVSRSPNIRILQDSQKLFNEEITLAEEKHAEFVADYRDYIFYSRLVEGMGKKQKQTQDIDCWLENQAIIDHIVQTRKLDEEAFVPHSNEQLPSINFFQDCDMMFEMDL